MWTVKEALTGRRVEIDDWRDWTLLPWWLLRYAFAWSWLKLAVLRDRLKGRPNHLLAWYGRHDDPTPIMCPRCLWAGPRRWLVHTYCGVGVDDVEPVDECPRCGLEI